MLLILHSFYFQLYNLLKIIFKYLQIFIIFLMCFLCLHFTNKIINKLKKQYNFRTQILNLLERNKGLKEKLSFYIKTIIKNITSDVI